MSRFSAGDRVQIRDDQTMFHSRVPAYAKGCVGVVERVLPDFVIPEDDAWGRLWENGRVATLYRIQLHQSDTWPSYRGSSSDTTELEIFQNWLAPAQETTT